MPDNNLILDASLRLISSAMDEYIDWHSQVLRHVYYAEYVENDPVPEMPPAIPALREMLKNQPDMTLGEIDRVFKAADAMQEMVAQVLIVSANERALTFAQFHDFSMLFDDMIHRLHRIERSQYLSGLGYDETTGLRSGDVMFQDLDREMERVARRGRSFSLTLARLDRASEVQTKLGARFLEFQRYLGQAILYTIRTFDDAYHLAGHEYVMALKHADLQGAQRFVLRLREYFDERPFHVNNQEVDFSLSFCVAEPVVGESMSDVLEMMRRDLTVRAGQTADALVYHEEESPLRRYLREQQQQKGR